MQERLTILKRFKNGYNWSDRQNAKWLNLLIIVKMVLVALTFSLVFAVIISDLLNLQFKVSWNKSTLFIIVTLSSFIDTPLLLHQRNIIKHKNKLVDKLIENPMLVKLNEELAKIITDLNNRFSRRWYIVTLAAIILVLALYHFTFDGTDNVWEWSKIPLMLFYIATVTEYFYMQKQLMKNINKTEEFL